MNWKRKMLQDKHLTEHQRYLSSISKMTAAEQQQATNIIMILMDDMGWGDLSYFGSKSIRTPNLDRLAREGVVLENGYSSSPVCSPSRFGLMTGRYPCRGLVEHVFFPSVPVEERYVLPPGYEREEDEVNGVVTTAYIEHLKEANKRRIETLQVNGILEDEVTVAEMLQARGYKTGMFGKWHLGDHSPHLPNDKGFDYFFGAHYSNDMTPYHFWRNNEIAVEAKLDQRRITEYLNKELFSFIRQQANNPFFAYYASPWPHHPLSCGSSFAGTSKGGVYGDCIQEFDAGIGQMLDLLEEQQLLEKTLIVFSSDNGPWHQGSPGWHRGRKGNVFDGGQLVPTICSWPGHFRNCVISEQVMNIDFLPTFCDIAGIALPEDREIDGKSLLPLLTGVSTESPHDYLYFIQSQMPVESGQGYAIRSRDHFKYHQATNSENAAYKGMVIHPYLFDLNYDRDESYDVRKNHLEKAAEMKARLQAFNQSVQNNPRGWR